MSGPARWAQLYGCLLVLIVGVAALATMDPAPPADPGPPIALPAVIGGYRRLDGGVPRAGAGASVAAAAYGRTGRPAITLVVARRRYASRIKVEDLLGSDAPAQRSDVATVQGVGYRCGTLAYESQPVGFCEWADGEYAGLLVAFEITFADPSSQALVHAKEAHDLLE